MPTGVYERKPKPLADPMPRFWKNVNKTETCWLWTACTAGGGYGRFWHKGHNEPASRFIYEHLHGELPKHLMVCHHCDNPPCVNPEHLFRGTRKDNAQDAVSKGRWNRKPHKPETYKRGAANNRTKLTAEQVAEIRRIYCPGEAPHYNPVGMRSLAKRFNVTKYTIFSLLHGLTWRHLDSLIV